MSHVLMRHAFCVSSVMFYAFIVGWLLLLFYPLITQTALDCLVVKSYLAFFWLIN